eukprot:104851-Pelagomonas_calceolata.AAC.7
MLDLPPGPLQLVKAGKKPNDNARASTHNTHRSIHSEDSLAPGMHGGGEGVHALIPDIWQSRWTRPKMNKKLDAEDGHGHEKPAHVIQEQRKTNNEGRQTWA